MEHMLADDPEEVAAVVLYDGTGYCEECVKNVLG